MLVIADSATPMVLVEDLTKARSSVFGAKPTAAIASSTARTVSGETFRVLLRTCETVVTDTPARFATSIIVAKMRSADGQRLPPPPISGLPEIGSYQRPNRA